MAGALAGAVLAPAAPEAGARGAGAGWLALALWLARNDLAARARRRPGLPRFMAAALLSGYAWLAAAGLLALHAGATAAGPAHDAVLHALFLGFVFAMVFAHAPVIFPAVLGLSLEFRPRFYAHLVLLHAGLLLRLAGDLTGHAPARAWGGLLNAVALALFLANTLSALRRRAAGGLSAGPGR
jgi:hypothetical protein